MSSLHIVNARLLTPCRLISQGEMLIENGRIAWVSGSCGSIRPKKGTARIDAHGVYLAPGFVDTHRDASEVAVTETGDVASKLVLPM